MESSLLCTSYTFQTESLLLQFVSVYTYIYPYHKVTLGSRLRSYVISVIVLRYLFFFFDHYKFNYIIIFCIKLYLSFY